MDKKFEALVPLRLTLLLIGCLIVIGITTQKSFSQERRSENSIVSVKPIPPDAPVAFGEKFELILELTIAPNFHINSQKPEDEVLIPTSVEFKKDQLFEVKEIIFPEARKKKFKFSDRPLSVYEGKIKIKIKIELAEDFCGSSLELEGKVRYQACNDEACLRPASLPFKAVLKIAA
ncbi:MAG: protein-disulfide reductase DsbD domain-containing protein [Candidatus Saccharicenans sp.]|uniref:protein-disulfide reductase DsbD domain-containing protein n=1 Tax=Candidatus Saccharicenans sp. TaxID=2819258 RepID=UPI00404921AC